jgi:biotin carboxyl carrier protein
VRLAVAPGDRVEAGQVVAVVEAMKMETRLAAARAGTVAAVNAAVGAAVSAGRVVVELTDEE